jgi:hypothetical protein
MKDMLTKKDKQVKKNAEGDDDSLDMNVFEKLMEGKQPMFVTKSNDDLISINDTEPFDYSMQDKITHKISEHNNYNNDYDEFVKLLPLPQPPLRARTDARTNPSAQRATQLRSVLARVYAVAGQNQITTTVP